MKRPALFALAALAACSSVPDPDPASDDPYARFVAALELGNDGDLAGVVRLCDDPEPLVRGGAVLGLARIGGPEVTPHVVEMTYPRSANDALVRGEACRVLGELGDPAGVPALISALKGDPAAEVRRTAALALDRFTGERRVLEALVEALGDPQAPVAHNAHQVLSRAASRTDLPRERGPWQDWLRTR